MFKTTKLSWFHLVDGSGIEACRQIVATCPDTTVLILSTFDWDVYLARAWAAGAAGFVVKTAEMDERVRIIRTVAHGKQAFAPDQLERIQTWQREVEARLQALTSREWEVLRLLVAGCTNTEIAEEFIISVKTVECHVSRILAKLAIPSRREVIAWANRARALVA